MAHQFDPKVLGLAFIFMIQVYTGDMHHGQQLCLTAQKAIRSAPQRPSKFGRNMPQQNVIPGLTHAYDLNQCLVRVRTYLRAKPDQKPTCYRLQHAMISFFRNTCAVSHLAFWVFAPWQWNCNITSGQYLRWHLRPILQTLCRMNARLQGTCFFGLSHVNNLKQVEAG